MNQSYKKYSLTKPFNFELVTAEIRTLFPDEILVRPTVLSICNADLRYYSGSRRKTDLKKKLPMALIHEGIGEIIATGSLANSKLVGKKAILIPNIPCWIVNKHPKERCEICSTVGENYCPKSIFLSSGHDGYTQELVFLHKNNVLPYKDIPDEIAVLSELISVTHNLFRRVSTKSTSKILIYGDGPVAYIVASYLSEVREIPKEHLVIAGIDDDKLIKFDFCTTINTLNHNINKHALEFDIIIECIGGKQSKTSINHGIGLVKPGGTIALIGVSENKVPINTRDILAKGLHLVGTSRSETSDYKSIIPYLQKSSFQTKLAKVIHKTLPYKNPAELQQIFDYALDKTKYWGKIIIKNSIK